jgi:hypothetical protein
MQQIDGAAASNLPKDLAQKCKIAADKAEKDVGKLEDMELLGQAFCLGMCT